MFKLDSEITPIALITKIILRLNTTKPDLLEFSKKVEAVTAPLLRPSKLVKVGTPVPAAIQLAENLAEKVISSCIYNNFEDKYHI